MTARRWLRSCPFLLLAVARPADALPVAPAPTVPAPGADCSAQAATLHADLQVSRSAGTAPLAVFFDATASRASGHSRPFHTLRYDWSFGDDGRDGGPRFWTNGASHGRRDTAAGPVAAHVFTAAGTYPVCLTVIDGTHRTQQQVQVDVLDPAVTFAAAHTVCFSATGTFTDAPDGLCRNAATAITTAELATVLARAAPGMRLLLRRGETFHARTEGAVTVPGPGLLGAYGTQPAPPRLLAHLPPGAVLLNFSPAASDWRVQDLELACAGAAFCLQARDQVTVLRVLAHDGTVGFAFSGDGSALVDSVFRDVGGHPSGYAVYAGVTTAHFAAIGNLLDLGEVPGTAPTHVLRAWWLRKAVLSDNTLRHAGLHFHLLKLHAPSVERRATPRYSEQVVIANNRFEGGRNPWMVVLGPQNAQVDERVRDVLVEHNLFLQGTDPAAAALVLSATASDISVRANLFDLDPAGGTGVLRDQPDTGPPGSARDVTGNTFRCPPQPQCTPIRSDPSLAARLDGNRVTR